MKAQAIHRRTFRRGSRTYFNSSLFFPPRVRQEVFILYAFVRRADDCVDNRPQRPDDLARLKRSYLEALRGRTADDPIASSFAELASRRGFREEWVDGFFHAMEMDLSKTAYDTLDETIDYMYGSAEVIGLFMARILQLPGEADHPAQMQGRAMQYINFLRDVAEDLALGRTYLPISETRLPSLDEEQARRAPEEFVRFMRAQLSRYRDWQAQAREGYHLMPRRYLIPVKTASDMYDWTGRQIERDPFVVFRGKVRPGRTRILARVLANALTDGKPAGGSSVG